MIIYAIFQCVLIFGSAICIAYPFSLGILALFSRRKENEKTAFNHSFLLVIYSHNKEQEISKTLYSLSGLVYPWNLYDLIVIADHCTDNTAAIAKKFGANVLEYSRSDKNNTTDMLHWALGQVEHVDEKYDAIVFAKPNDLISGNFLEIMNQYLEEGSTIIQSGHRKIADLTTWKIKYQRLCWLLRTVINALGRKKLGLGTMLLGSGMCCKTEVLINNPIELCHTQDDFERSIIPPTKDFQVDFAPEAVIWSPIQDSSAKARHNQSPLTSRFRKIKKQLKYVTSCFSKGKLLQGFDLLMQMITPPLLFMSVVVIANGILNLVLWKLGYISVWFWLIWMILMGMLAVYLSIGIAADQDGAPELINKAKKKRTFDSEDKLLPDR